MPEENEQGQDPEQQQQQEVKQEPDKAALKDKYASRGAQRLSLNEYLALQKKQKQKANKKLKLPKPVLIVLAIPFLIIGLFGAIWIPILFFRFITAIFSGDKWF